MKQALQLKIGQHLTMTPQLQQAIRLLQLSTLDLQQEIQEILESNPLLETEDELAADSTNNNDDNLDEFTDTASGDDYAGEFAEPQVTAEERSTSEQLNEGSLPDEMSDMPELDDTGDEAPDTNWDETWQPTASSSTGTGLPDGEYSFENRNGTTEDLQSHLLWQLNLTPISDRDQIIALAIIDAVEPTGLLNQTVGDIYEGLLARWHNEQLPEDEQLLLEEVAAVLHRVQQFDPPGVAAQNLQECLLIQLNQLHEDTPWLLDAKLIVSEYLDLLAAHDYKTLMRKSGIRENTLKAAIKLIQSLNPQPGNVIDTSTTEYVVPDVYVGKRAGHWHIELNPDIAPRLRINEEYASLIKRADNSSANTFIKDHLQEARWFLKSLESRNDTLVKVATAIVEHQKNFLEYGEEAMKPLVLHDIADAVGMHESTVSRVTTQKYMHTPQGVFELKYFFSSHVPTASGGECSSTAIRALIKKLVAAENPKKPLSDNKITQLLEEQGIKVARRTIAKYRESLNIPPSNERKRLV